MDRLTDGWTGGRDWFIWTLTGKCVLEMVESPVFDYIGAIKKVS